MKAIYCSLNYILFLNRNPRSTWFAEHVLPTSEHITQMDTQIPKFLEALKCSEFFPWWMNNISNIQSALLTLIDHFEVPFDIFCSRSDIQGGDISQPDSSAFPLPLLNSSPLHLQS